MDFTSFYNNYKTQPFDKKPQLIKEYAKLIGGSVADVKAEIKKNEKVSESPKKSFHEFYATLTKNAKAGKIDNLELFYDYATNKYLYTRNESVEDDNGNVEYRQILDFYEEKAVKRLILEAGKKDLNELLDNDIVVETTKWLPSYIKGFNPHRSAIYDTNIKNMCILPVHLTKKAEKKIQTDELHNKVSDLKNINILLDNLFVKKEYKHYFLNWLSYIVQTKRKTRNTIVLVGEQGTGKGNLQNYILSWFFGESNCVEAGNKELKSEFNHLFDNRLFVFFNEIKGDFKEGNTIYETLKPYISDPNFMVNMKNVAQYQTQNHFNTMFFSNHEVPLQVEGSDRRYSIFKTSQTKIENRVEDLSKYINGLKMEREDFLNILLSFEYDKDLAFSLIETDQKNKIIELSNTKQDLMKTKVTQKDKNYFENIILDLIEKKEEIKEVRELRHSKESNLREPIYFDKTNNEMFIEFMKNIDFGVFANDTLKWFYKIYMSDTDSNSKISKFWSYVFDDEARMGKDRIRVKLLKTAESALLGDVLFELIDGKWIEKIKITYETINEKGNLINEKGEELF